MREAIKTPRAPAAIGPYSQGIKFNGMVYTAGQVPIDPATGKLVEGDITVQTEQVLKNLSAILEAAGTSLQHAIKTLVFLHNVADFAEMNKVYAQWFDPAMPPARSTVSNLDLPLGALIEIEVIAEIPG
jgi:2-iminobutanoate/2-iminopropanoate deaminase